MQSKHKPPPLGSPRGHKHAPASSAEGHAAHVHDDRATGGDAPLPRMHTLTACFNAHIHTKACTRASRALRAMPGFGGRQRATNVRSFADSGIQNSGVDDALCFRPHVGVTTTA